MLDPINNVEVLVPSAILVASFLGSSHCVSMCGPLTTVYASTKRTSILYHFGRLFSYALLGAVSGAFGKIILGNLFFKYLPWFTAISMSVLFIYLGVARIVGKPMHLPVPAFLTKVYSKIAKNSKPDDKKQAFTVGILSAFLPCGWLYSFVAAAALTQSAVLGAISLSLFWLGTVPALLSASVIVAKILKPLGRYSPKVSGILLILAGFFTIGIRSVPLVYKAMEIKSVSSEDETTVCPFHKK